MIESFTGEYEFLSNFYVCPVTYNGITYKSSEHAYQAAKALTKEDHDAVMNCKTPGQAKRMGAKIQIKPDWDKIKNRVMFDIVYNKFDQNKEIREKLFATCDELLVEGNYWGDCYWGICGGKGLNYLGKILMEIRGGNTL